MAACRRFAVIFFAVLGGALQAQTAQITVDASQVLNHLSPCVTTGACIEDVNHEIYGGIYSQVIFGESFQEPAKSSAQISGMWSAVLRGSAKGSFGLVAEHPFVGSQSQALTFTGGDGEIGVANSSLNGWGMNFVRDKDYSGFIWAKSAASADLFVAMENSDGSKIYGERKLAVKSGDWQRIDFTITPQADDPRGRFAIKLKSPGSVTLGYVFLEPGNWGLFRGLPLRRDVTQGLIDQGIKVLRYGGSMVNAPEYRWKKMIGPREKRPPYKGTWYPYSTNGWGIIDFLNMCEAAGFMGIPAFNCNESPQDMADFVQYVNGPASSTWGAKRVADGHAQPYGLKYFEFGNEERIDDAYWEKFRAVATAVWAADPDIIIVVGDFSYDHPITDPFHFDGAASQITSLEAQQKILDLARQNNREVWFDVHIPTDKPEVSSTLAALPTYIAAMKKIANGAKHKVVVFELNAGIHDQTRALSNALATNYVSRLAGQIPIVTSANCLQPDGQNDNGWDQGLLFLNPSQVWLQPPGYVTQMLARNNLPLLVKSEVQSPDDALDVIAKQSEDHKELVLQVVNTAGKPISAAINVAGFSPVLPTYRADELVGALKAVNTAQQPKQVAAAEVEWPDHLVKRCVSYTFKPYSFTILRISSQ